MIVICKYCVYFNKKKIHLKIRLKHNKPLYDNEKNYTDCHPSLCLVDSSMQ